MGGGAQGRAAFPVKVTPKNDPPKGAAAANVGGASGFSSTFSKEPKLRAVLTRLRAVPGVREPDRPVSGRDAPVSGREVPGREAGGVLQLVHVVPVSGRDAPVPSRDAGVRALAQLSRVDGLLDESVVSCVVGREALLLVVKRDE